MIRVVMTVPITAGSPGIIQVIAIVIAVIVAATIIIPVIELGPAVTVANAHVQIAVFVILVVFLGLTILLLLYTGIFICRPGRGEIHIIGSLSGFVSGGTAAKRCYCECQE